MAAENPGLSAEYHKAHRILALISGLIIAWQYIDVKLPEVATVTLMDQKIEIGHPGVVPVALLLMLVYFGARLAIEWFQCAPECRKGPAARADVGIAYGLAVLAIVIFTLQVVSPFRVANVMNAPVVIWLIMLLSAVPFVWMAVLTAKRKWLNHLVSNGIDDLLPGWPAAANAEHAKLQTTIGIVGAIVAIVVGVAVCALATVNSTTPLWVLLIGYAANTFYVYQPVVLISRGNAERKILERQELVKGLIAGKKSK